MKNKGTYLLHHQWTRVLLEKMTGSQLVTKFPTFYRTRRFVTACTSARQLSLSRGSSIQSLPPHSTSLRSILILFSYLCLGLSSVLFTSVFPIQACINLSSPSYVLHAPPISFYSIGSPEQCWASITDHKALHCVVFSTPLLPRPS